ncbi:unnamed protein product [Phaedon cochleariae]|uniref:SLC41A/MgtE integral membrane domain-containing protein n=1 Tax=Phaedon cochleariae TaxID=80249 RepID=A0A9N9X1V8_PHACE|nr:unnamed protein product [Phaedon cochleariae]
MEVYTIQGFDNIEPISTNVAFSKNIKQQAKTRTEKWYHVIIQVSIPFLIAGVGTTAAGLVMAYVSKQAVFQEVKTLFILVPALLGLKGNLDMCLASRLSTQANLGHMKSKNDMLKMIFGNVLLVQIQAIVASCIASIYAIAASAVIKNTFSWSYTLLVITSSVLSATISCFVLDLALIVMILFSRKINWNPDNLATPMAASIGDVVSLIVFSIFANYLFDLLDDFAWAIGLILAMYLVVLLPVSGGMILDLAVDVFNGYAIFQPIINGIGGNLVSVHASRTSTMLHKTSIFGMIPTNTKIFAGPWSALIKGVYPAKTARLLILISLPGHTLFVFAADAIYNGSSTVSAVFVLTYLSVGLIQIMILLYVCHIMVHLMWKNEIDPDNSAIPYLTAFGDLLGSALLLLGFQFLRSVHREYQTVH